MTEPESYDEYAPIAELYDHIVPYRDRPDVNFFVESAAAGRRSCP